MSCFLFLLLSAFLVSGILYERLAGWQEGRNVYYYNFTSSHTNDTMTTIPLYILRYLNGVQIPDQKYFEFAPSDDPWIADVRYVSVVDTYDPNNNNLDNIDTSNMNITGIYWNTPIVDPTDLLEIPTDAPLDYAWYNQRRYWFFNFGPCQLLTGKVYDFGDNISDPIFQYIPGDPAYTPILLQQTPNAAVRQRFESGIDAPNYYRNESQLNTAEWIPQQQYWNCPIVAVAPTSGSEF